MGGECHADRKPPLPSKREGMPCGLEAHPYPPKGRECHADRKPPPPSKREGMPCGQRPTPTLPKGGSAMRIGRPPLPSQREGVPCGFIVSDFEACVLSAAAPLLLGGVGGRLSQRSSSPPI